MTSDIRQLIEKRKRLVEVHRENNFEKGFTQLLTKLYPDNAHFVYELLQNAEDAKATEVEFVLKPDRIEFTHNGTKLFSMEDIEAITNIGNTNKENDHTSIGKFGVGFKAVFSYTETPEIRSGHYHFRIRDLVVPEIDGIPQPIEKEELTFFSFPFNQTDKPQWKARKEIGRNLRELNENTLLFLTHIKKIRYTLPNNQTGYIELQESRSNKIIIVYKRPGEDSLTTESFLRFSKNVSVMDEEGYNTQCKIAVAFALNPGTHPEDKLKIVPLEPGRVSIYFPAEKESSGLRFHIHAPFASTVARDSVRDCASNERLRDHLAKLVADSLVKIRDQGLLGMEFLSVLPNTKDQLSPFYLPFLNQIILAFQNKALTPMKRGGYAKAGEIFRGPVTLSDLIPDEDLAMILSLDPNCTLWVENASIRNQRQLNFLSCLGIQEWGWKDFFNTFFFSSGKSNKIYPLIKQKSNEWHQKLYALIFDQIHNRQFSGQSYSEYLGLMKIIRLEDGSYARGEDCFFPDDEVAIDDPFPRVSKNVLCSGQNQLQQDKARVFLKSIGVRDVSEQDKIESLLKRNYSHSCTDLTASKRQITDIRRFVSFIKKQPKQEKLFKDFPIIKRIDGKWSLPEHVYLDAPFSDTGLSEYYEALEDKTPVKAISQEYLSCGVPTEKLTDFFRKMGVKTRLEIQCQESPRSFDNLSKKDYKIDFLDILLKKPNEKKALLLWKTLKTLEDENGSSRKKPIAYSQFKKKGYSRIGSPDKPSTLIKLLKESAWIPQKKDLITKDPLTFVKPSQANSRLLPKGFVIDNGWFWLAEVGFGGLLEENPSAHFEKTTPENPKKSTPEDREKEKIVKSIGFESIEKAQDIAKLIKIDPKGFEKWKNRHTANPAFPEKKIKNPERRITKLKEQVSDAPDVVYEERPRTVRTSSSSSDPATWLRNEYTNVDGIMMCQICKEEMPFKKRNGEYYFEAVELFSKHIFSKEYEAHYIALCPLCAAMYKEWIKNDEIAMQKLKEKIIKSHTPEISIQLGELETSLRFVETHFQSIQHILGTVE